MNVRKYTDAVESISNALAAVKKNIADADDENDSVVAHRAAVFYAPHSAFVKLDGIVTPKCDSKSCFMSANPIFMQKPTEECHVGLQYLATQSFILLYNLALAYHLRALDDDNSSSSSRTLRKAASLYELAYSFHENEGIQCSVMQIMSIMNNLGHIHTMLDNGSAARHYFQNLLSTIMYVNFTCGDIRSCEDIEGYVNNALSSMIQDAAMASAA